MSDDVLKCWGYNNKGQLGNGNKLNQTRPAIVLGLSGGIKQVAMGTEHTCILYNAGNVQCWGSNQYGKLGNTSAPLESLSPVDVTGLNNVMSIEAGHHHTCAIINDGTAKCWGLNDKGQLGDGTTINKTTPVTMQGVSNIKQLSIEYLRTMALTTDGHLKFWGHNNSGTFGDGTTTDSLTIVDGPY